MSDFSEIAEVSMEAALYPQGGGATSLTNIAQRNIDMRSGSVAVRDGNGNTISMGLMPDNQLGLSITDAAGFLLFKLTGTTWYWYDKVNNKNVMQVGKLPDGTYGFAVANTGKDVSSGF